MAGFVKERGVIVHAVVEPNRYSFFLFASFVMFLKVTIAYIGNTKLIEGRLA